jgi:hypothetical protein
MSLIKIAITFAVLTSLLCGTLWYLGKGLQSVSDRQYQTSGLQQVEQELEQK